jgi:regulator of nucleoside diphosphate kinase
MSMHIVVTTADVHRLEQLLESEFAQSSDRLAALEQELDRAETVNPEDVSPRIVTMNSRVRIYDLDRNAESACTLVYPADASLEQNRVSVLAPLGTALLGRRVGQTVRFSAPGGARRVKITAIEYQPESAAGGQITQV